MAFLSEEERRKRLLATINAGNQAAQQKRVSKGLGVNPNVKYYNPFDGSSRSFAIKDVHNPNIPAFQKSLSSGLPFQNGGGNAPSPFDFMNGDSEFDPNAPWDEDYTNYRRESILRSAKNGEPLTQAEIDFLQGKTDKVAFEKATLSEEESKEYAKKATANKMKYYSELINEKDGVTYYPEAITYDELNSLLNEEEKSKIGFIKQDQDHRQAHASIKYAKQIGKKEVVFPIDGNLVKMDVDQAIKITKPGFNWEAFKFKAGVGTDKKKATTNTAATVLSGFNPAITVGMNLLNPSSLLNKSVNDGIKEGIFKGLQVTDTGGAALRTGINNLQNNRSFLKGVKEGASKSLTGQYYDNPQDLVLGKHILTDAGWSKNEDKPWYSFNNMAHGITGFGIDVISGLTPAAATSKIASRSGTALVKSMDDRLRLIAQHKKTYNYDNLDPEIKKLYDAAYENLTKTGQWAVKEDFNLTNPEILKGVDATGEAFERSMQKSLSPNSVFRNNTHAFNETDKYPILANQRMNETNEFFRNQQNNINNIVNNFNPNTAVPNKTPPRPLTADELINELKNTPNTPTTVSTLAGSREGLGDNLIPFSALDDNLLYSRNYVDEVGLKNPRPREIDPTQPQRSRVDVDAYRERLQEEANILRNSLSDPMYLTQGLSMFGKEIVPAKVVDSVMDKMVYNKPIKSLVNSKLGNRVWNFTDKVGSTFNKRWGLERDFTHAVNRAMNTADRQHETDYELVQQIFEGVSKQDREKLSEYLVGELDYKDVPAIFKERIQVYSTKGFTKEQKELAKKDPKNQYKDRIQWVRDFFEKTAKDEGIPDEHLNKNYLNTIINASNDDIAKAFNKHKHEGRSDWTAEEIEKRFFTKDQGFNPSNRHAGKKSFDNPLMLERIMGLDVEKDAGKLLLQRMRDRNDFLAQKRLVEETEGKVFGGERIDFSNTDSAYTNYARDMYKYQNYYDVNPMLRGLRKYNVWWKNDVMNAPFTGSGIRNLLGGGINAAIHGARPSDLIDSLLQRFGKGSGGYVELDPNVVKNPLSRWYRTHFAENPYYWDEATGKLESFGKYKDFGDGRTPVTPGKGAIKKEEIAQNPLTGRKLTMGKNDLNKVFASQGIGNGFFRMDFAPREVGQQQIGKNHFANKWLNPANTQNNWYKMMQNFHGGIESQLRGTQFMRGLRNHGIDSQKALDNAGMYTEDIHFNYNPRNLTNVERNIRDYAIPFYVFTKNNAILNAKTGITRPNALNAAINLERNMNDTEGNQQNDSFFPDFMKGGIRLGDGYLSTSFSPVNEYNDLVSNPGKKVANMLAPGIKAIYDGLISQHTNNRQLGTGYDLTGDRSTMPFGHWLYENMPEVAKMLGIKEDEDGDILQSARWKTVISDLFPLNNRLPQGGENVLNQDDPEYKDGMLPNQLSDLKNIDWQYFLQQFGGLNYKKDEQVDPEMWRSFEAQRFNELSEQEILKRVQDGTLPQGSLDVPDVPDDRFSFGKIQSQYYKDLKDIEQAKATKQKRKMSGYEFEPFVLPDGTLLDEYGNTIGYRGNDPLPEYRRKELQEKANEGAIRREYLQNLEKYYDSIGGNMTTEDYIKYHGITPEDIKFYNRNTVDSNTLNSVLSNFQSPLPHEIQKEFDDNIVKVQKAMERDEKSRSNGYSGYNPYRLDDGYVRDRYWNALRYETNDNLTQEQINEINRNIALAQEESRILAKLEELYKRYNGNVPIEEYIKLRGY